MILGDLGGMGVGWMVEGTAVMRGRARNARLIRQMMYVIWFSF